MDRAQKKQWVADLRSELETAHSVIVVHYKGLTVAQVTALRTKLKGLGANMKVTKNKLARLAIADTQYANLNQHLTGPTAVAYSKDPVAAAKGLVEFAKDNESLVILGGVMDKEVLDKNAVESLAKLPSLDELRAKLIALIQTPATRIAGVVQAPAGQIARVVNAYSTKQNG